MKRVEYDILYVNGVYRYYIRQ